MKSLMSPRDFLKEKEFKLWTDYHISYSAFIQ